MPAKPRQPGKRTAKKTSRKALKASRAKSNILLLHGPNLNLLGEREPEVYGSMTLKELNQKLQAHVRPLGCEMKIHQSNSEGRLIDLIHAARKWADVIIINPGAYTHYSYALRDALAAVALPAYEVHLSDIHSREEFRRISVIRDVCVAQISGAGWKSYVQAIDQFLMSRADQAQRGE